MWIPGFRFDYRTLFKQKKKVSAIDRHHLWLTCSFSLWSHSCSSRFSVTHSQVDNSIGPLSLGETFVRLVSWAFCQTLNFLSLPFFFPPAFAWLHYGVIFLWSFVGFNHQEELLKKICLPVCFMQLKGLFVCFWFTVNFMCSCVSAAWGLISIYSLEDATNQHAVIKQFVFNVRQQQTNHRWH